MSMRNSRASLVYAAAGADTANDSEITAAVGQDAPTPLQTLLGDARSMNYAARECLYHQGGPADTVSFVTRGILKLVTHLPNGRARIVRLHRTGSVLGLNGLLTQDNKHTAIAVTPVTTLRLPISALQRLRRDDPATYVHLVECWNRYLEDADTWITQFSAGPIRGRVARLLMFLLEFEEVNPRHDVQLLTCDEMGSVLGVTCESTSRILAEFKRRRILTGKGEHGTEIYTADIERLRTIAELE